MRRIAILSFLAAYSTTLASFELGLIAAGDRIHRVDLQSGAYFGSFPSRANSVRSIAVDSSIGVVYVLGDSFLGQVVSAIDYNTGQVIGGFAVTGAISGASTLTLGANGELLFGTFAGVHRRTATGASIGVPLFYRFYGDDFDHSPGAYYDAVDGAYYMPSERVSTGWSSDFVIGVNSSNTWVGNYAYGDGNPSLYGFADAAISGRRMAVMRATGNDYYISLLERNSGSGSLSSRLYAFWGTEPVRPQVEIGHGRNVYVARMTGANVGTAWLDFETGATEFYDFPQIASNVQGFAVVSAPEPGTMVVLGLGALALLRRRRSR